MSLSPPKFVQMLRKRDHDDLTARLREMANVWDAMVTDKGAAPELRWCASELRKEIDKISC